MAYALTRAIPTTFANATMEVAAAIDTDLARSQHAAYLDALRTIGLSVTELAADDAFPDCCFIEDCAVLIDGVALITRPGAASRRGEVEAVAAALSTHPLVRQIVTMSEPATLDGGDCMRVGNRVFVGQSLRTNKAGVAQLAATFSNLTIVPVALRNVLHLKCVCSPLGEGRVLLAEGTIDPEVFGGLSLVTIPYAERYAANCVTHNNVAIIAAGFPATRRAIEREGLHALALPMSEIQKADGSLTCLSLVVTA